MQLLSKQPGYHRPQPAAPPALPWAQQGQMQPQHAGWNAQPAPQYQQAQYQPQQAQQAWQQPSQVWPSLLQLSHTAHLAPAPWHTFLHFTGYPWDICFCSNSNFGRGTAKKGVPQSIVARHGTKIGRHGVSTRVSEAVFCRTAVSEGGNRQISVQAPLDTPLFSGK